MAEFARSRASCHSKFLLLPIDERIVVFEPVISEEDVVLSSEVDDLHADSLAMQGSGAVGELEFGFYVFLDIAVD